MIERKIKSKSILFWAIILFTFLLFLNLLPQQSHVVQNDIESLIQKGREFYKTGEYEKAIIKFFEAKELARTEIELSDIYEHLALAYYDNAQKEKAEENLWKLFVIQPDRDIEKWYFSPNFLTFFYEKKIEFTEHMLKDGSLLAKNKRERAPLSTKAIEEDWDVVIKDYFPDAYFYFNKTKDYSQYKVYEGKLVDHGKDYSAKAMYIPQKEVLTISFDWKSTVCVYSVCLMSGSVFSGSYYFHDTYNFARGVFVTITEGSL